MKSIWVFLVLVGLGAVYTLGHVVYRELIIEKPDFDVLKRADGYEIRRYNSVIVAEVDAGLAKEGGGELNDSFMKIAGYIFGGNKSKSGEGSEKIAMTAPVLDSYVGGDSRRVAFVLPKEWELESLPTPDNEEVIVRKTDPQVVAVRTLFGSWNDVKYKRELAKLRQQLTADGVEYMDGVTLAYYDPPSAPWFVRKTEVMVELKISVEADLADGDIPEDASVATLAGGCFWCIEAPFDNREGVYAAISGYAGGSEEDAEYYKVASGKTKHREAVRVYFDAGILSYEELLKIYWRQIDPTDAGGQFADRGFHYTTAIFYHDDSQRQVAEKTRDELIASKQFDEVVTEILPVTTFFKAEEKHQNFAQKQSAYYQQYKYGSGRGDFIDKNWGG